MNVLMLATAPPYPPTSGGTLRVWNILKQVARSHSVTLIAMSTAEVPPDALQAMRAYTQKIVIVRRPLNIPRRVVSGLRSLASTTPFTLANFMFPAFADAVRHELAAASYDIVHAHCLHTAQYWRHFGTCARYFDCQNINSELWRRYSEATSSAFRSAFTARQARLLDVFEPEIHKIFDVTTFCSKNDYAYARRNAPNATLAVVANGVDSAEYLPSADPIEPYSIVLTASMDAAQNTDAAIYLARDVFPQIRARQPNAKLYLVGRNPPVELQKFASDHLVITGTVPDVRSYIARAHVYVAPIRIGGGTRLKLLEAMAMKKAIVTTTVGAEGIEYQPDVHMLIGDDVEAFADNVNRLFEDEPLRRRLGEHGRALVESTYDWSITGRDIGDLYEQAVAAASARRGA